MSDNLESYFKKHLRDETPVPEQWNVPSDDVWTKVQPEIDKRKGIFIPWKYLYILGIGLVLLVSTLILLPENNVEPVANKNVAETQTENEIQTHTKASTSGVLQEKELEAAEADNLKVETPNSTLVSENASSDVTFLQKTKENKTNSESTTLKNQTGIVVNESSKADNREVESSESTLTLKNEAGDETPQLKITENKSNSEIYILKERAGVLVNENNDNGLLNENEIQTETKASISVVILEKELEADEADNQNIETPNSTLVLENASSDVTFLQKTQENKTNPETQILTEQNGILVNESNESGHLIENNNPVENPINIALVTAVVVNVGVENSNENKSTSRIKVSDNYSVNTNRDEADIKKSEADFFVYSNPIGQFPDDQSLSKLKGYDYLNGQKARPISYSPGKFGVGAYYAPTYTSTEVSGLELPGNDQMGNTFLFSNNWGFDFYYYLSYRFTIVSGIGSSEIRSWSKTSSQFNYDSSTEHDMGNNQTANGTEQTSPTPFGSLSSEVVYSFPSDANIPDGELMESVSETFQNIRYLSIPIGIEYNLLNQEKSLWFLETGFNYNISMRDQTELLPQIIHEGEEMNIMDSRITQDPNYENNYWGFYIGTGYKYPVSDRIQLNGTVRYNRSISPLKSIGSATTNVQGYQLKVGVVYLLH